MAYRGPLAEYKEEVARAWAARGPVAFCGFLGVRFERQGYSAIINCLWHEDKTPSLSVTVGPQGTLRGHCFSCQRTWDAYAMLAQRLGLDIRSDFPTVLTRSAEGLGRWDIVDAIEGRKVCRAPAPTPTAPTPPAQPERTYPDVEQVWDLLAPVCTCRRRRRGICAARIAGPRPARSRRARTSRSRCPRLLDRCRAGLEAAQVRGCRRGTGSSHSFSTIMESFAAYALGACPTLPRSG